MSYLTRHFQAKGQIVGSLDNREIFHKMLARSRVPRKAVIVYSKAVCGSPKAREALGAKLEPLMGRTFRNANEKPIPIILDTKGFNINRNPQMVMRGDTELTPGASFGREITIGATYRPKRANQHTKNITVMGFTRTKGVSSVNYSQGEKRGVMTLEEWRANVGKRL